MVTFDIVTIGVGRKDYSVLIEESVNLAGFRTHQTRTSYNANYPGVPTIPYPFAYDILMVFLVKGQYSFTIPDSVENLFYEWRVDGDTAAQTYLGISIFDNDGAIGVPLKIIGRKLAPRTATYNFAKGLDIRKWAGKYLFFHFAHYTPNPTFTLSFTILALEDTLISELIPLPGSI